MKYGSLSYKRHYDGEIVVLADLYLHDFFLKTGDLSSLNDFIAEGLAQKDRTVRQ